MYVVGGRAKKIIQDPIITITRFICSQVEALHNVYDDDHVKNGICLFII